MLSYFRKNDILYAKTMGKSVRDGSTVRKKDQKHIGRVIDKENNVFYSRERGIFTYDPITDEYGKADEIYSTELKKDRRRKEKLLVDFGDAFFLHQVIKDMQYDTVLDAIGYGNPDTLKAMVMYYIISDAANCHAQTWFDGSFAKILYPNANLKSQRISDFLSSIGEEQRQRDYFKAHISWVKEMISDDPAIIVDSTGLPNDIDTYLKNFSNHNGKISRECRMSVALQRDSGYPLLYRVHPGNIVDSTTLQRTIILLSLYDIYADMALLDAGYCTAPIIDELYDNEIDFMTRLPDSTNMYKELVEKCLPGLKRKENLVEYNGRFMYIDRAEIHVGDKKRKGYGYLGMDVDRSTDEIHKASRKTGDKKKSAEEMHKIITNAGLFGLLSSLPYESKDAVPTYYIRQMVEQYFDIGKGISRMTPLRGHSEETIFGHLLLCQAASTINLYIQQKMKQFPDDREELLMSLRNQKCTVHETKIVTAEPQSKANEFYKAFGIQCPASFTRNDGKITPINGIGFK
ncbi:MAG: transposase [Solobacterium sp.]|nr:transposase [Solobacterium sp.]